MNKKFYIADLHIGHENAIKFDNRPFRNVEEMNDKLISNWNSVVGKNDTVYVIGDFIWYREQDWPMILEQLKGNIVLINGNHDPSKFSSKTKNYFQDIKDYKTVLDEDKHVIMCHYPIPFYKNDMYDDHVMLYGHVHRSIEYKYLKQMYDFIKNDDCDKKPKMKAVNVGCMMEWMNYTPRTLNEIMNNYKE